MLLLAPCKINLGLNVVSKRSDGYHNIETMFYPVPLNDVVEIIPRSDLEKDEGIYVDGLCFNQSGLVIDSAPEKNLCVRAFQLMRSHFNLPDTWMQLHKVVPMGAGLGGGSSDASQVLVGLNKLYSLNLTTEQLIGYAAQLGSDCAFFIECQPSYASGRGEVLEKSDPFIKHHHIAIVKPDIFISTADAYSMLSPKSAKFPISEIWKIRIEKWTDSIENDFEKPVFEKYPVVKQIKEKLIECGADFALMSGSGSAVYAISYSKLNIENQFPDCFVWQGVL